MDIMQSLNSQALLIIIWCCFMFSFTTCQFPSFLFSRSPGRGPSPYDFPPYKYQPQLPHGLPLPPPPPPPHPLPPHLNLIPHFPEKHPKLPPKDGFTPVGPPVPRFKPFNSSLSPRDNRILSLFTIVQFPKDICTTAAGDNGTCLNVHECQMKGGIAAGTCANNFGACCVFMSTCGETIRENGTYFVNQGYPSGYNGTMSCQVIIDKIVPSVCQYRLDFEQFSLSGPEPINHICNYDQLIVSGSNSIPVICGVNTGNHIYVDVGPGISASVILSVTTSGPEVTRYWKIRVTQITCPSSIKEEGCLQYHTGVSGTLKSFNYEPSIGLQLSNQDYSICIRAERNFCSIQYSQCLDTLNNRSHSFTLTGNTLGQNAVQSMTESSNCNTDWLLIPCAENVNSIHPRSSNCVDRFCGGTLNTELQSTLASTIISSVKPFRLFFHTNSVESPDMGNVGFCLQYVQIPCNSKL